MNDLDFDTPGTLSYYATLLEDPTTQITMDVRDRDATGFMWYFLVSTPEDRAKTYAWGTWSN